MIQLKHLNKVFNRGKVNEVEALRDINLEISKGTFLVLVGSNGSGKSTLLNILAGSIPPGSGQILLNGKDLSTVPDYARSKWIARVFQDPLGGTAPELSILENFRLAALRTGPKRLVIGTDHSFRRLVAEKISALNMGLEDKLDQPMGTLSGGQRQALTLLMSVMDNTEILLLDEPTAALDPLAARTVMETANHIIQTHSLTAILVTHDMREAIAYGNRLIQMDRGLIKRDISGKEKENLEAESIFRWFLS